ncbi:hypothetical protein [Bradyrhizobium sp.]|uniref:hypothetical protein n=1 Tax=Bradyrhizobium sp. TaxID=376 RepID=UPI0025BCF488|nr:hypothetical protein [Bradyrhizobium sp.]
MNAISNVLPHAVTKARTDSNSFKTIMLFCCLGLVASLLLATAGVDLGVGSY